VFVDGVDVERSNIKPLTPTSKIKTAVRAIHRNWDLFADGRTSCWAAREEAELWEAPILSGEPKDV
jgi:hypothetical protein